MSTINYLLKNKNIKNNKLNFNCDIYFNICEIITNILIFVDCINFLISSSLIKLS
jgi:hypothetical protein